MTKQTKTTGISRRAVLGAAGVGVAAAAGSVFAPKAALATAEDVQAEIGKLQGGAGAKEGKVTVDLPQIAENGRTVPITVIVESPQSEADYVKAIHILAEVNPVPVIAHYELTPLSGMAKVATRIRLAKTQDVFAVAEMSDGSVWTGKKTVKVTIGGCGG